MVITETIHPHVLEIPASAWTPAVEADGTVRDGAWVAELTGSLLDGWPQGACAWSSARNDRILVLS